LPLRRVLKNSGVKLAPGSQGRKKGSIFLQGDFAAVQENNFKNRFNVNLDYKLILV